MLTLLFTFFTASLLTECVSGYVETVVAVAGRRVNLPCRTPPEERETDVCWGRGEPSLFTCRNTVLSTDGTRVTFRSSNRYRFDSKLQNGDVSMSIHSPEETDTGFYHCRVQLRGLFNDQISTTHLIVIPATVGFTVTAPGIPQPVKRTTSSKHVTFRSRSKGSLWPFQRAFQTPHTTPKTTSGGITAGETAGDVTEDPEDSYVNPRASRARSTEDPVFHLRPQFERLQSYIGNTIRLSAAIFVPVLLLVAIHRLRTREQGYPSRYSVPEETLL